MFDCVDYQRLFQSQKVVSDAKNSTHVEKTRLDDVIFPLRKCFQRLVHFNYSFLFIFTKILFVRMSMVMWVILVIVIIFWLFRLIKAIYNIARYGEIKAFYSTALGIQTKELPNFTWHEVQERLLQMQKKHHLCIHKQELTELDIYNRILRFKNYEVAMVNQALLPPKIDMPGFGQM